MSGALPVIGYAGMTHLGLNSAVGAAEKGFALQPHPQGGIIFIPLKDGKPMEPDEFQRLTRTARLAPEGRRSAKTNVKPLMTG